MKTTAIRIAFVAIIISVTSIFSANAQSFPDFFFDKKYEGGKMVSKTKYELSESGLHEKTYLYKYTYDELGKLDKEETYRWNKEKAGWERDYCISRTYSGIMNTTTLEYMTWNKKEMRYNDASEKAVYQLDEYGNTISCIISKAKDKTFEGMTMATTIDTIYY